MKVVISTCYGGFSLSEAGIDRYAEIKSLKLYKKESESEFRIIPWHYYTSPDFEEDSFWACRDIDRHDPALVQTVEEIGKGANGEFADLEIVEIPDGVKYTIEEYDGVEWVAEEHRTWS